MIADVATTLLVVFMFSFLVGTVVVVVANMFLILTDRTWQPPVEQGVAPMFCPRCGMAVEYTYVHTDVVRHVRVDDTPNGWPIFEERKFCYESPRIDCGPRLRRHYRWMGQLIDLERRHEHDAFDRRTGLPRA